MRRLDHPYWTASQLTGRRGGYIVEAARGIAAPWFVEEVVERLRHLNFFQHECYLEVVPRIKLPSGKVALVETYWGRQARRLRLGMATLADLLLLRHKNLS